MSYRPITDFWFLARAKLKNGKKYYGAYLGGFPERARVLIGCGVQDRVLHVCGGMARHYPYRGGFGPNDMTLDLNPDTEPDFLMDCRERFPMTKNPNPKEGIWHGILMDPPYSEADADAYPATGSSKYPSPSGLINNALAAVAIGRKVGLIHYALPKMPKNAKFTACVGIACGFGNRLRCFSVFERLS
jgi:hypothetical protein